MASASVSRESVSQSAVFPQGVPGWVPLLLGFLTAVGPISTDIYLPAFPAMEDTFHTDAGNVQMTLSIWFVGLAIGQLSVGPLSDRYGRRMPMLVGNLIYTVASAVCAFAPDILTFSIARFVASLGASASLVIPTACVRDMVPDRNAGAKMLSRLVMVMGVVPILAPMLGGLVVAVASWRVIFWASAAYGAICVLCVLFLLPETLPFQKRVALSPVTLVTRYLTLLRDRGFTSHAMVTGFSTFMQFSYLTAASFVFIKIFGFSPLHFSMLFGVFSVFMIGASQVNGILVGRIDSARLLQGAVIVSLLGGALLVAVVAWGKWYAGPAWRHDQVWLMIGAMLLTLAPTGIIFPNAMMGALADHPSLAGAAAALAGTMQYVMGALAGALLGMFPTTSALPMAGCMFFGTVMMLFVCALRPKASEPQSQESGAG
ncbi:multidrug effflux MFS transporter [Acetobacter tropicalis]|uniref:Bcr/CflA family efflux transporter n=1 Tax=Acetobacter tropicalis TaxID=104102 RepID=A0A149TXK5_9PROT|nr:multidrug effflux MFS transporter [Acetobacter tropicalis]KXV57826.1 multidrug ABC transporter [Acetobacter tropicalis]OUI82840.1 multidrug ABC transporter [Acetobacter tropicalis]